MKKKKCYIYTRVSTTAQVDGYSLEAQQEKLHQYAEYKNLKIVGEYCDAGKSGKSIQGRPAFMEMLDDISSEKDEIAYVLVFKLSRFGRNAADILKSLQLLADYDVDLVCVEDAIDSSTQGGRLTLAILSAVAEIERENINVQLISGKIQKLMEGGWAGGPAPYGYRSVDKELVIEPSEAEIVKLIYDLYLREDMKGNTVVRWMNDHGYIRTYKGEQRPFNSDFIKTVLSNPIYCGTLMYNRRTNLKGSQVKPKQELSFKGKHEPIVSEEQWQAVQEKRDALYVKNHKVDEPDRISLLSGIVRCPVCGSGMVASKNKHKNKNTGGYYKTIYYYSCKNYRKSEGRTCEFKHTYNQDKADQAVMEIISRISTSDKLEKALNNAIGSHISIADFERKLKETKKNLHSQEHRKYKLGEVLDNLDILADNYDAEYSKLQEQIDETYDKIEEYEGKIKTLKRKISLVKKGVNSADNIKLILNHFYLLFDKMDYSERRELCRSFIDKIEMYPEEQPDGRIVKSISFKFPVFISDPSDMKEDDGEPDEVVDFVFDCSKTGPTVAEAKATYTQIKSYVLEHFDFKVSTLYIAQIKRKYGIDIGVAYNKVEKTKNHVPKCPKEKELAIMEAFKAYRMLAENVEYFEGGSRSEE